MRHEVASGMKYEVLSVPVQAFCTGTGFLYRRSVQDFLASRIIYEVSVQEFRLTCTGRPVQAGCTELILF